MDYSKEFRLIVKSKEKEKHLTRLLSELHQMFWTVILVILHNVLLWWGLRSFPGLNWGALPRGDWMIGGNLLDTVNPLSSPLFSYLVPALILFGVVFVVGQIVGKSCKTPSFAVGLRTSATLRVLSPLCNSFFVLMALCAFALFLGAFGVFPFKWGVNAPGLTEGPDADVYAFVNVDRNLPNQSVSSSFYYNNKPVFAFDSPGASVWDRIEVVLLDDLRGDQPWMATHISTPCTRAPSKLTCFGGAEGGVAQFIEHLSLVLWKDSASPCSSVWDLDGDGEVSWSEFDSGTCNSSGPQGDWASQPSFQNWDQVALKRLFLLVARVDDPVSLKNIRFNKADLNVLLSKWTALPIFWGFLLLVLGGYVKKLGSLGVQPPFYANLTPESDFDSMEESIENSTAVCNPAVQQAICALGASDGVEREEIVGFRDV